MERACMSQVAQWETSYGYGADLGVLPDYFHPLADRACESH